MKNKGNKPARERVVMNEAAGFGHVKPLDADQLKRLASDSPANNTPDWLSKCRATRTKSEGSQA